VKVTLWRQDVALRHAVTAAHERHDQRSRLFLEVEHDGVVGYGEVAPQLVALNGDPSFADVLDEVRAFVLPQLDRIVEREQAPPSWSRVARFAGPRPASNPAVALLEMALLDRELRAAAETISDRWPALFDTPRQSTVSLLEPGDEWHVAEGVARVRAKTAPGRPSEEALARLAGLAVPVLLDFNCSATNDAEVLEQVRLVRDVAEVVGVEQPYAAGNVVDHARLAEQLDVTLSVDEGLRSLRDLAQIVRYRAAGIVCVKPARVGGLANARTLIARARDAGLHPYVGGFFESPYARGVHRALCANGVDEPSDLDDVAVVSARHAREVDVVEGGFGLRPAGPMLQRAALVPVGGGRGI
jgi:O-succinylbenzoate synthase